MTSVRMQAKEMEEGKAVAATFLTRNNGETNNTSTRTYQRDLTLKENPNCLMHTTDDWTNLIPTITEKKRLKTRGVYDRRNIE